MSIRFVVFIYSYAIKSLDIVVLNIDTVAEEFVTHVAISNLGSIKGTANTWYIYPYTIIDFVEFIARGCYAYLLSIEDCMDMDTWQCN